MDVGGRVTKDRLPRMSANNHRGQEVKTFHKQAEYMRAMILSHIDDQMSCKRGGSIYVGKGREQERKLEDSPSDRSGTNCIFD